jgi:hypothetical protein
MKIGCFYPNVSDYTSFYRGHGVLCELEKMKIEIENLIQCDWVNLKNKDIIFFQRPFRSVEGKSEVEAVKLCKLYNKKVWVDYDDLLIDCPDHIPITKQHGKKQISENVKNILGRADLVTVSTESLKRDLQPFAVKSEIVVIPNAWDDYLFPINTRHTCKPMTKTVIWRGSDTHKFDLMKYEKDIVETINAFPDFKFIFMGYNPSFITTKAKQKNVTLIAGADIGLYMQFLNEISAYLVIVPLEDNAFNQSKSNVAALEASWAGAHCLAPNWPEWQHALIDNYDTNKEGSFKEKLFENLTNYDKSISAEGNWEWVKSERLLSRINLSRISELIKLEAK